MRLPSRAFSLIVPLAVLAVTPKGSSPVLLAQPAPAQARPAETVAVDFYAVTNDGQPVGDLKPEEVQLRVDGRPRPIKWMEWVPVAPADETGAPMAPIPAPFGSNAEK